MLAGDQVGLWAGRVDSEGTLEWAFSAGNHDEGSYDDACYPRCDIEEALALADPLLTGQQELRAVASTPDGRWLFGGGGGYGEVPSFQVVLGSLDATSDTACPPYHEASLAPNPLEYRLLPADVRLEEGGFEVTETDVVTLEDLPFSPEPLCR